MNPNINPEGLPNPFTHFCVSIGAIPTSYKNALDYYETLLWLIKYLENTVIPAVDNNAEALEEVQGLFVTLKDYVEHYFDNLDVQEEINNKLDEMAESGDLDRIIIAENTIIMGDSYALGVTNDGQDNLTSWADILKSYLENENQYTSCLKIAEPGSGFIRQGTAGHTFLTLLQSQINNITNKNQIKNVILCGGYNDKDSNLNDIRTAVVNFVNYCYTQFPNCKVYIGCIGYRYEISSNGAAVREHIVKRVYPAYANNVSSNVLTRPYIYLNGVENILKSLPKTYMYIEDPHPNQAGQNALGVGIYQAFKSGNVRNYYEGNITVTNSNASEVTANIPVIHTGENLLIAINSLQVKFTEESNTTLPVNSNFELGEYNVNGFVGGCNNIYNTCEAYVSVQDYSNHRYTFPVYLTFNILGKITMTSWLTADGSSVQINGVKQIDVYRTRLLIPELLS